MFDTLDDDRDRETAAGALGYARTATRPVRVEAKAAGDIEPQGELNAGGLNEQPPPLDPDSPVSLWRATKVTYQFDLDEVPTVTLRPADPDDVLSLDDIGRQRDPGGPQVPVPERPGIVPWSRLRRQMEAVSRAPRPIGEVDLDAVVDTLGRGKVLRRLPRLERRTRVRRLFVVLDRAPRLLPFWEDQIEVCQRVVREFGQDDVDVLIWEAGPPRWNPDDDGEALEAVSEVLCPGDALLVLGDLGIYGHRDELDDVERQEERARALGPSARRWLRLGRALTEAGVRCAALLPCPNRRWPTQLTKWWRCIDWGHPQVGIGGGGPLDAGPDDALARLLGLMSLCVALEPDLLRELRMLVPGADLGTEADAWNHPEAERARWGMRLSASLRREGERRSLAMLDSDVELVRAAVDVVRQRHRWSPKEIWLEEVTRIAAVTRGAPGEWVTDAEVDEATRFVQKLRSSLEHPEKALSHREGVDLDGWLMRALAGADARVSELGRDHPSFGVDLGRVVELAIKRRPEELRSSAPPRGYGVDTFTPDGLRREWSLRQQGDSLKLCGRAGPGEERGSPLVDLVGYTGQVCVGETLVEVEETELWRLPELGEQIVVTTTGQRVELERLEKPSWANGIGRDERGLWASFKVGGVVQRMRWIPPGRFWMGSPEDEEGRWEDEGPRRAVRLTRGFWMAETPCTQALWEAVMGDNPSRFKDEKRPVDRVSWEDTKGFITKLDRGTTPGFALPTEAQWEYACRAGTQAPRYGELDEVAWHYKNSGRGTHEVGLKLANAWGLYDMLGNVREWCEDWLGDYLPDMREDPSGARRGSRRVRRGGSWFDSARRVRAAFRHGYRPGSRSGFLGFRLVRGQASKQASKQEKQGRPSESGGPDPRPTGVVSKRGRSRT